MKRPALDLLLDALETAEPMFEPSAPVNDAVTVLDIPLRVVRKARVELMAALREAKK